MDNQNIFSKEQVDAIGKFFDQQAAREQLAQGASSIAGNVAFSGDTRFSGDTKFSRGTQFSGDTKFSNNTSFSKNTNFSNNTAFSQAIGFSPDVGFSQSVKFGGDPSFMERDSLRSRIGGIPGSMLKKMALGLLSGFQKAFGEEDAPRLGGLRKPMFPGRLSAEDMEGDSLLNRLKEKRRQW